MDTNTASVLCARLKLLRASKNLTQKEFAEKIGASSVSVSSYEIGVKTPSLDMLLTIAKAFSVSLDWLCGFSELKNTSSQPETQADILQCLFAIERCTPLDIFSNEELITVNSNNEYPDYENVKLHEVAFLDTTLNNYIFEWKKILSLYQNHTIDDELYALWIEKTLKKASDLRGDGFPMELT